MLKNISNKSALIILILITALAAFLRLYRLTESPPSLFVDEADVGYQAYSLINTQKDYFGNFLPTHLQSFADFRTPFYIFATIPSVLLFGLNSFSVRIPAAIFGIVNIPVLYFLTRHFLKKLELRHQILLGLSSAFFLSILPWHIHYSRVAFEVTMLLLFLSIGLLLFFEYLAKKNPILLFLSIGFFCLTPYIYSTAKLMAPLLLLIILFLYRTEVLKIGKTSMLIGLGVALIIASPLIIDIFFGQGLSRFSVLSVFANKNTIGPFQHFQWLSSYANYYIPFIFVHPQKLSLIFLSRPVQLFIDIFSAYFSAFSPQFLMFNGDPNPRHSLPTIGVFGVTTTIIFYIGLYHLFKNISNLQNRLLLGLLVISPLPASITIEGQYHATRNFLFILPATIIMCLGIYQLLVQKSKFLLPIFVILITLLSFEILRNQYLQQVIYPKSSYIYWNWGWQENSYKIKSLHKNYDYVFVDNLGGTPVQTFYAFYNYINPNDFQRLTKTGKFQLDIIGITISGHRFSSDNIIYTDLDPTLIDQPLPYKILAVVPASKLSEKTYRNIEIVDTVKNPLGDDFYIFITNKIINPKTP